MSFPVCQEAQRGTGVHRELVLGHSVLSLCRPHQHTTLHVPRAGVTILSLMALGFLAHGS